MFGDSAPEILWFQAPNEVDCKRWDTLNRKASWFYDTSFLHCLSHLFDVVGQEVGAAEIPGSYLNGELAFIVTAVALICYLTILITCSSTLKFLLHCLIQGLASRATCLGLPASRVRVDEALPLDRKMLSFSQELGSWHSKVRCNLWTISVARNKFSKTLATQARDNHSLQKSDVGSYF